MYTLKLHATKLLLKLLDGKTAISTQKSSTIKESDEPVGRGM